MGSTAGSRGRVGCLLFLPRGRRVASRLGGGGGGAARTGRATEISVPAPGGCERPPPCLLLGRRRGPRATPGVPASCRLCSTCPHIGGNPLGSVAPLAGVSGTNLRMAPSGSGSKGRLASGTVCGDSAPPGPDASRARVAGAGPRPWTASGCASACSHSSQCVAPIWRSGLPLHRRSWKAWNQ